MKYKCWLIPISANIEYLTVQTIWIYMIHEHIQISLFSIINEIRVKKHVAYFLVHPVYCAISCSGWALLYENYHEDWHQARHNMAVSERVRLPSAVYTLMQQHPSLLSVGLQTNISV